MFKKIIAGLKWLAGLYGLRSGGITRVSSVRSGYNHVTVDDLMRGPVASPTDYPNGIRGVDFIVDSLGNAIKVDKPLVEGAPFDVSIDSGYVLSKTAVPVTPSTITKEIVISNEEYINEGYRRITDRRGRVSYRDARGRMVSRVEATFPPV